MLVAGFRSKSLVHKNCYEQKISIPSLHVFGTTDEIIPHELSAELACSFDSPIIVQHAGGHYFASTVNEKQTYVNFFQDQLQAYLEDRELKVNGIVTRDEDDEEQEDEN
jgi:hypothetical protein